MKANTAKSSARSKAKSLRAKFSPTPEQAAASLERRTKMKSLARTIAAMTPGERMKLFAKHPVVTIEGRALSMFNTCLLISQSECVTVVGGFNQWRAAGRSVRKGERGLAIWIPIRAKEDPLRQDGEMSSADEAKFMLGTVFDVSQTDEIAAVQAESDEDRWAKEQIRDERP